MSKDVLLAALAPILNALPALVDKTPAESKAELERLFPIASLTALKALVRRGVVEGWLCDKVAQSQTWGDGIGGDKSIRFSRVLKAADPSAFSVDAVHMACAGAGHTHPNGEFDLCFNVEGTPDFDGQPEGWTVYAKDTWHEPTVRGGVMDILYFLPGGQIRFESEFERKPA